MPGRQHQALLLWAVRRMTADGFVVAGFDGVADRGGSFNALPTPFSLAGRRPDAWAAKDGGRLIAFAEAKSAGDILSRRTLSQLRTFGAVRMKDGASLCPLYVAVPREAAPMLDEALRSAGLISARNVIRIHVPEVLLTETGRAA